ncbi:hypothetical protein MD484_g4823, partial [Candolleomyces efflorescens]
MPRILSLSPTTIPIKPYPSRLHVPSGRIPKHELYLDLSSLDDKGWCPARSGPGGPPPGFYDLPAMRDDWYPSIQEAIARHRDIDAVNIYRCNSSEWPSPELWKALSGGRPTHLELTAGALEDCDYAGLKDVEPVWPLKSVYLACSEGDGEWDWEGERGPGGPQWLKPSFPECYAGIETLVLHYVLNSVYFYPEGEARNLRSLTIMENDFVATFARGDSCSPAENWHIERMKDFFLNAKALVNIELMLNDTKLYGFGENSPVLHDGSAEDSKDDEDSKEEEDPSTTSNPSHHLGLSEDVLPSSPTPDEHSAEDDDPISYLGLSDVLPASLTSLSFRGPANKFMLDDLDNWIRNAKQDTWLPRLRTVALKIDLPCYVKGASLEAEAREELDAKVHEFLGLLAKRDPPVQIVEPRTTKEMEYPLEF